MMVLYDEEEIMRSYVESEVNDAILETRVKMAESMIRGNDDQGEKKFPQIDIHKTGQKIRHIMQMKGMTVKDVQGYLGLAAPQSIYHWFAGRCLPTVDNLYALSELFCVPMDGLVCGSRQNEFTFCYHPGYQRFLMYYNKCLELLTTE